MYVVKYKEPFSGVDLYNDPDNMGTVFQRNAARFDTREAAKKVANEQTQHYRWIHRVVKLVPRMAGT